jgi:hypothetical protein
MDKDLFDKVRLVVANVAGIPLVRVKEDTVVTRAFRAEVLSGLGLSENQDVCAMVRITVTDLVRALR